MELPNQEMIRLCEPATDAKGIRLEIYYKRPTHTVEVIVSYKSKIDDSVSIRKTTKFPANRWNVPLPDSIKALREAEQLAKEIEREFGL